MAPCRVSRSVSDIRTAPRNSSPTMLLPGPSPDISITQALLGSGDGRADAPPQQNLSNKRNSSGGRADPGGLGTDRKRVGPGRRGVERPREGEVQGGPAVDVVDRPDPAAGPLDDALADGEAEPEAALLPCVGGVHLFEPVEDPAQP